MIALLQHAHRPYHHIRLTKQFSADVAWWRTFIVMWNGVGIFPPMAQPTVEFTSDASGNWGCGAWSGTAWFQFQWPQGAAHRHIAFLELVAVRYGPGAGMDKVSCACVITKLQYK